MIKFTLKKAALILIFINTCLSAQTSTNISKPEINEPNYIVTASSGNVTLTATQSITLRANTHIQSGSTFTARIAPDAYIPTSLSNENYIYTKTFQSPLASSTGISDNKDVTESITYFDGLGRPMQNIKIKASPDKQDIVTHIGYDNFGRIENDYLPYLDSGTIASYRTGAETKTNNYYISKYANDIDSNSPNPFSRKNFDDSPLNRVMQQGNPGKDWAIGSGHEIKMDYLTNASNEVKLFTASATWDSTLGLYQTNLGNSAGNVFYETNQLYRNILQDENNSTVEEFKDKEGHVVLKKAYNYDNSTSDYLPHETYYVYDVYGNLTYVIPPKADGAITPAVLNDLCYQYKYDELNRLVEKKLPGKDWEYIVYDNLDRPILTQDGNLRKDSNNTPINKWIFTKYDAFDRPIYTGEYLNNTETTRLSVQTLANSSSILSEKKEAVSRIIHGTSMNVNINYSNDAFPNTGIDLLTINYYDDYLNITSELDGGTPATSYGINPITNPKGLITCSKVRVLGTTVWNTTVSYYDIKGRSIYNYSRNNYLDATSTIKSQLDFGNKVTETISTLKKGDNAVITLTDVYSYDHTGRLLNQKQTINDQIQEVIADNVYDDLGQLTTKNVGGKITQPRLQNINYSYNIRGWLKNINDINAIGNDLFSFSINYNTTSSGATPLFNGNISQTFWRTANIDNSLKSYTYNYDNLNRMISALGDQNDQQEIPGYDKNGNIISMYRTDKRPANSSTSKKVMQTIDNLTYTYDGGNKLLKVEDSADPTEGFKNGANLATEYTYDHNGNMKTDANKGLTAITYNYLNLPVDVSMAQGTINYTYDAAGTKQRKEVSGIKTDYVGGFQYENNVLKFFTQPEGYVTYNSGSFSYIYQYKDHLGNIRLSYQDKDNNGVVNQSEIVQENNYYPFGLLQKGYNETINGVDNKYKYNGKELQDENIGGVQLSLYDYGARNYDPALGRWMNIDPLSEVSRRFSPYTYALNNPVYFIDPDGMQAEAGQSGNYYDWDKKKYINKNSGKTVDAETAIASHMDDNGYDENGNQVNTRGGDTTDYLYDKYGKVISSTSVKFRAISQGEFGSNGGKLRGYGFKGWKMATGNSQSMELTSPFFSWSWAFKGLGAVWNVAFGTSVKTAEASGSVYSVAYETTLSSELFPGGTYYGHFKAANTALNTAIETDASLASSMYELGITVPKSSAGSILGKSPTNWVWHHAVEPGVMQLVPKVQHTPGSIFWNTLHPGGIGGMAIWNKL